MFGLLASFLNDRERRKVDRAERAKVETANKEQLAALAALRDEDIDLSDAPEVTDWSNGVRGKYYRA